MKSSIAQLLGLTAFLVHITPSFTQTYSTCNPLYTTGCTPNTALGKTATFDFTKGASSQFSTSGAPTYDSKNGATFTVAKSGDAPTIASGWYLMFGKVEVVMKTAPGTGICSTLVLQSDDLDEIDLEFMGYQSNEVQTNYFGKGLTTSTNRGVTVSAPNDQTSFNTYTIEWTSKQIVWSINGVTVRVLTAADAVSGQYPQTPMQVKLGAWAPGDAANAPGTIAWAGGAVDYSQGPFNMYVKSLKVQDYSTGSQYQYTGTSGTWQEIKAIGGSVYTGSGGASGPVSGASSSSSTSSSGQAPAFGTSGEGESASTLTRTGWPWVSTATATSSPSYGYASSASTLYHTASSTTTSFPAHSSLHTSSALGSKVKSTANATTTTATTTHHGAHIKSYNTTSNANSTRSSTTSSTSTSSVRKSLTTSTTYIYVTPQSASSSLASASAIPQSSSGASSRSTQHIFSSAVLALIVALSLHILNI